MSLINTLFTMVVAINIMLFLGQAAVNSLPIDNTPNNQFYSCQGTILGSQDANNCQGNTYVMNDTQPTNNLPTAVTGSTSVPSSTGFFLTDAFTTAANWFVSKVPGSAFLINLLTAPSNFAQAMGAPPELAFAISSGWYAITFILLVAWMLGREA